MTFGEKLKELREEAGMSQAALSSAAEIGLPTLKDYEGNRRGPSLEIAQRLAGALGVTCQAFDGCEFRHASQTARTAKPAATKPAARKRKGK
jgi:transcriptional regulator with XRE-family HTH domain